MTTPSLLAARGSRADLFVPVLGLIRWRSAFFQFLARAIGRRYRGSAFGILWALIVPLMTLGIYAFVFGTVMQSRWDTGAGGSTNFTINLFAGLLVFWLMADAMGQAPAAVIEHANLVKKAMFPLEIIPAVIVGNALVHTGINVIVLLGGMLALGMPIPLTVLWLPIVLAPFALLMLGLAWILAALGVFFRDLTQLVGLVLTGALFLSPVFYALSRLPEPMAVAIQFNPVTVIVEQARNVLILGEVPDLRALLVYAAVAWLVAVLGLMFFRRARDSFADVL